MIRSVTMNQYLSQELCVVECYSFGFLLFDEQLELNIPSPSDERLSRMEIKNKLKQRDLKQVRLLAFSSESKKKQGLKRTLFNKYLKQVRLLAF